MKKFLSQIFVLILVVISTFMPCLAVNSPSEESLYTFVPAGVKLEGILSENIDFSAIVTGQKVEVILLNDFIYNNTVIVPTDSVIIGKITNKKTKNGKLLSLKIKFTSIRTLYNNIIPVNSTVELENNSSVKMLAANEKIKLYFSQPITLGAK